MCIPLYEYTHSSRENRGLPVQHFGDDVALGGIPGPSSCRAMFHPAFDRIGTGKPASRRESGTQGDLRFARCRTQTEFAVEHMKSRLNYLK